MKMRMLANLALFLLTGASPAAAGPAEYRWQGFYIGLNGGADIAGGDFKIRPSGCADLKKNPCVSPAALPGLTAERDIDAASFTGGGQVGYNLQFGMLVLGVETDINFDSFDETTTGFVTGGVTNRQVPYSVSSELDWFGTLRGRLGIAVSPALLLYGTGGFAYGGTDSRTHVGPFVDGDFYRGSHSATDTGWTVGGGGEWAFARKWTARAEYLLIDLGSKDYIGKCGGTAACNIGPPAFYRADVETRENVIRLGLNYSFNSTPAPSAGPLK